MTDEERSEQEPEPESAAAASTEAGADEQQAHAEPVTLTYGEYEELRTLARERDEYLKRLQRAVADYQNLQKRIDRFRDSVREATLRSLAESILPMADSLTRAVEAAMSTKGAQNIVEGLRLVEKDFYGALERFDIRPMESVGQPFDPHFHEALMQVPPEGRPPGTVAQELKKGFVMGDAVMRPSQVVVTANDDSSQDSGEPAEGTQDAAAQDAAAQDADAQGGDGEPDA